MTVIAYVPLFVAIVSALIFVLVTRPDVKQLAGWSFLAAMIALMISSSGHAVRLGF